jgi:hypothetical protein
MENFNLEDIPFNQRLLQQKMMEDDNDMEMMTMEDVPYNQKLLQQKIKEDDLEMATLEEDKNFQKLVNIDEEQ